MLTAFHGLLPLASRQKPWPMKSSKWGAKGGNGCGGGTDGGIGGSAGGKGGKRGAGGGGGGGGAQSLSIRESTG